MRHSLLLSCISLLSALLFTPDAKAQSIMYKVGFEQNEIIPSPQTPPLDSSYNLGGLAGQGGYGSADGTTGWTSGSIGTIVGTVGDIVAPNGTQMLEVSRLASGDAREFRNVFAGNSEGAGGDFIFSFKIAADMKTNAAIGVSIGSGSAGSSGIWVGIRPIDSVNFGFFYRDGSSSWIRLGSNTVNLKEFYRFNVEFDSASNTFNVTVYDSLNIVQGQKSGAGVYFASGYSSILSYNRVYSTIDQIGSTKFYLDDICVLELPTWKAVIIPASINADNTVRLAGGHTQHIPFTLQANEPVIDHSNAQQIALEFDFPAGVNIILQSGVFTLTETSRETLGQRTIVRYDALIPNSAILGSPGSKISSEWNLHSLFVNTPASIPPEESHLIIRVIDGIKTRTFTWPLAMEELVPPAQRAQRTAIGMWSYSYRRAIQPPASTGIANFLQSSGVTFMQSGQEGYYTALQQKGIAVGGDTHHSYFSPQNAGGQYVDQKADGTNIMDNFVDPQAIINLPQGTPIPGVNELVANTRAYGGFATYDYEPSGLEGFSPLSIATFKAFYNVSNTDFAAFRNQVAISGLNIHASTNPLILDLWGKWTEFRSWQTSNYVRRIFEAVKAQEPNARIVLTTMRSHQQGSDSAFTLGVNSADMAQYADIIMPQFYVGYGSAAAKLVMLDTERWVKELEEQNAQAELWPLLLVRYAGASVFNSPQRLYQQSIGAMAHGANGLMYYYPENMDVSYWNMLARLNEVLAKYEDYYHDGVRVDEEFPISSMPLATVQVGMYPGYNEPVENPDWAFTAHQLEDKVLLTLINLGSSSQIFNIDIGTSNYISGENVEVIGTEGSQWRVDAESVGYIILEREALHLQKVSSLKTHGNAGVCEVELELDGSGIEPRDSMNIMLVFTFDKNISGGTINIESGQANLVSSSISGSDLTVTLSQVTDVQKIEIGLENITGMSGSGYSGIFAFRRLTGDVDGNGVVNLTDNTIVQQKMGNSAPSAVREDVNLSGKVNAADIILIQKKLGNSVGN